MKSILFLLLILLAGFYFFSLNFIVTILCISFLIFFHELGHFLAAKHMGVCVEVFSIGFGKSLFEAEFKGTIYKICALPLGGYVKLKGQDDFDPSKRNYEADSYNTLTPLKRIYILFAGPFFNIFLAFLLYIAIGNLGLIKQAAVVGDVLKGSAAEFYGLQKGDLILSIDEKNIRSFDEISKHLRLETMNFKIQRNEEILNLKIDANLSKAYNEFLQEIQKPVLGIQSSKELVTVFRSGFDSFVFAFEESVNSTKLVMQAIVELITGGIDPRNIGGVITMADITSKAANSGLAVVLLISALISINLGVFNLLPIPMLDGGHIVFNLYEMIFKRQVPIKVFENLSYLGLVLLVCLMIFATYNDVLRFATR